MFCYLSGRAYKSIWACDLAFHTYRYLWEVTSISGLSGLLVTSRSDSLMMIILEASTIYYWDKRFASSYLLYPNFRIYADKVNIFNWNTDLINYRYLNCAIVSQRGIMIAGKGQKRKRDKNMTSQPATLTGHDVQVVAWSKQTHGNRIRQLDSVLQLGLYPDHKQKPITS